MFIWSLSKYDGSRGILQRFGKDDHLLSCREVDEKIDSTLYVERCSLERPNLFISELLR